MDIALPAESRARLHEAVRRNHPLSREGLLEWLFARAFDGLVYAQIWEDPEIDMEALALGPDSRVVAIASGGCNVLSYLTAGPARIDAVDLSPAHVALVRLKLAAAQRLPSWAAFYRFLGDATGRENVDAYDRLIAPRLDPASRAYWEGRSAALFGRRRISMLANGLHRHGLLGRFIGLAHLVARLYGVDPRELLAADTREQQRAFFEQRLAPLLDKPFVRRALDNRLSLYGLGIPPAQYEALSGGERMSAVVRRRLERLACGFAHGESYFAWQAFGRRYGGPEGSLPPYLRRESFDAVRLRASRVSVWHRSFTEHLRTAPNRSRDRYVLLDAQDWMTDAQLRALWREIDRTAAPGARVLFRTAGSSTLLPGRVEEPILRRWRYEAEASRGFAQRDRSAIYGGVHLYVLRGA